MKLATFSIFLILFLFNGKLYSNQTKTEKETLIQQSDTIMVFLKDFGLENTKKKDCTSIINKAFENLNTEKQKVVIFEKGTYHFFPNNSNQRDYYESNTTDINPRFCAFLFEEIKNLIIDGNGSTLIFHEQMQPFTFDNCQNVTLKNITIDWENPLTAQAEVLEVNDEYIDLGIPLKETPYSIQDDQLFFFEGKKEKNIWRSTMEFDRAGRFVVPETGDWGCLGEKWQNYVAVNIIPGIVRLYFNFTRKPAVGNFLVLRHSKRIHSGIYIQNSKNITIENVNLYHATGLGILAQFSKDLTFDAYRAIPNIEKNRYFGGGDDGLQVSNCMGQITVTNCEFAGLMDDPINVHGTSVKVLEIISDKKLKCKFMHKQSVGMKWGHPGDKISYIENKKMNPIAIGEVAEFESLDKENFILTLKENIPEQLEIEDALENLTWSPNLKVTNSQFKSCRARSLLVSTPGKVVIENNVFESSGSAILIAGDANGWFESGAVNDVLIRNNVFTELCNSSSYQFCEGIISIYPIIPELDENTPTFHKNIRIESNEFFPFDYPVLFARSVNGIFFEKNTVTRTHRFEPYHSRKYTFSFESCKNATILDNTFSEDLLGKNVLLKWTDEKELNCSPKQGLKIEEF